MSSSRVSVVPMTGSPGETMVNVYPLAVNNTHRTLATKATVSDGQDYQTVTIYHYGVPTAYPQGGGANLSFVSTGETKAVTVYSPSRDFKFHFGEGQWLTDISDSAGYVYQFDTRISKTRSTNTFYFTAAANNGPARSGNLIFEFYDNSFDTNSATTTIPVSQAAGEEAPYLSVSPAILYMDYDSAQTRSISVASNMPSWSFTNSNTTAFKTSATTTSRSGEIKVTNKIHNQAQLREGEYSKIYGQVDVDGVSAGTHYTGSVQVVQFYEPVLTTNGGMGHIIYASGGTLNMWANSPYDWWLTAPDWITFRYNGAPFSPTDDYRANATTSGGMNFTGIVAQNTGPEREGYIYLHFQRHDGRYDSTLGIKITQRTGEEEYVVFHDQWNENINKITFPYSANTNAARILFVSANTRWESSWATGGLFDLPYAETGTSGSTTVQINYEGLQDSDSAVTDTLIITTRGGRNFELMVKKPKKPTMYLWHDSNEVPATGGTKYLMLECDYQYWITPPSPSYIHWFDGNGNPLSGDSTNPNPGPYYGNEVIHATWDALPSGESSRANSFNMSYMPANGVMEQALYFPISFKQISDDDPDYVVFTPDVGYFSPYAQSGDTITFTFDAGTNYSVVFPGHMYNWDKFTVSPENASSGLTTVTVTYIGEYAPNTQYRTKLGGYKTSDGSSWGTIDIYKPAAD